MLRSVLSFLAALPLLLPPGLCVCHAPTAACAAEPAGEHHDEGLPGTVLFGLAHFCHHPPGLPGRPHGHTPGCPRVKDVTCLVVKPAYPVPDAVLAFVGAVLAGTGVALPRQAETVPSEQGPPEPPVPCYLALRTLRL